MEVFEQYGDYFPEYVQLGGKYYLLEESTQDASAFNKASTKSVSASVSVGYGPFSASAATASGSNQSQSGSSSQATADSTAQTVGGNTLLTGSPAAWVASLADHQNWRIIKLGKLRTTNEVLPERYAHAVNACQSSRIFNEIFKDPASREKSVAMARKYLCHPSASGRAGLQGSMDPCDGKCWFCAA